MRTTIVMLIAACALTGCGAQTGDRLAAQPAQSAESQPVLPSEFIVDTTSVLQAKTVREYVRAADLVLIGRVTAAERGHVETDTEAGIVRTSRDLTIEVEEVLRGAPRETVTVSTHGWLEVIGQGERPARSNSEIVLNTGDRALVLLREKRSRPGVYSFLAAHGVYRLPGGDEIEDTRREVPELVRSIERQKLSRIKAEMRAAAR